MKKILHVSLMVILLASSVRTDFWRSLDRFDRLEEALEEVEKFDDLELAEREKVTGGKVVAKGEFSFLASVQLSGVHSFTGSVISARKVLTCGHCLKFMKIEPELKAEYDVVIGIRNISQSIPKANKFKIQKFYIHPKYNPTATNRPVHDIGVIILDRDVEFKALNLTAAHLIGGGFTEDYTDCWVAGWGALNNEKEWSDVPHKYPVKVMNGDESKICVERIREALKPTGSLQTQSSTPLWTMAPGNICGISETGNHCQGDSGAPMWCKNKEEGYRAQIAIVSTTFGVDPGSKCGKKNGVSIYTAVGYHDMWIQGLSV